MANHLQKALVNNLIELQQITINQLIDKRYKKLMSMGVSKTQ
jgi:acetyl-CoA carboxylase alpha subunit